MEWFKKHLNLTFFFSWLIGNGLIFWGRSIAPPDGSLAPGWVLLFLLAFVIILGTEIWYLRQKERSMFNLLWNLLIYFGFIILLLLENNKGKQKVHMAKQDAQQGLPSNKTGIPCYDVLGVGISANQEEVRAAYIKKANVAQPSNGGSVEAAVEVNAAYDDVCKIKGWSK
jgi:hypothetical protein